MVRKRSILFAASLLFRAATQSVADPFVQQELRISLPPSGALSLEALLVRPSEPGRYPLALINHGSPRSGADRPNMTPWTMQPEALEFARRGWAAVVVLRRGYGASDGGWAEDFGACNNPDYIAAGVAAAADLKAAVAFLARRPDIDSSRVISVGVSAGGFATVALTADPPAGLVAAIDFAGGRGSLRDNEVCREDRLIDAYRSFGKRSRIPMLWVYAANDHFFGPKLAQQFKDAFTSGGGMVDFVAAAPFGNDGHGLFSPDGIPVWSGYVDAFLKERGLAMRATPLPVPRPAAPTTLSANGKKAFEAYVSHAPHKAFALSPDGHFGWRSAQRTVDAAKAGALQYCEQSGATCNVIFVDDAAVAKNPSAR